MKKIKLLLPIVALFFLASCGRNSETDRMVELLKKNKVDEKTLQHWLEPDTRCALDYLEKTKMSCARLAKLVGNQPPWSNGQDSACYNCANLTFCSVSRSELIQNVTNYRDHVWTATSNLSASTYSAEAYTAYTTGVAHPPNVPVIPTWSPEDVDAQYVDISLDDMRNYLCAIDNVNFKYPTTGLVIHPNTIRAYFIRYDGVNNPPRPDPDPNPSGASPYVNKHSICLVPVEKGAQGTVQSGEFLDKVVFNNDTTSLIWDIGRPDCQNQTQNFNRNMECPPFLGCFQNTILQQLLQ